MSKNYGSQSMIAPLQTVLVKRPSTAFGCADPEKWHYTERPYLPEAQNEHDAFVNLLRAEGIEVVYHDVELPDHADAIFVHDPSIVTNDGAIILQMGKELRQGEEAAHTAVYQNRPDVHAIIHTHQPYASALALINKPIPALFDEQVRFLGRSVEIIPYAPSGTSFLKNKVKGKIKNGSNAYILQNHGVLVLGGSTERAIHNMALLEKCALAYLLALLTEEKVSKIPLPIREIAFAKLRADEKKFAASG